MMCDRCQNTGLLHAPDRLHFCACAVGQARQAEAVARKRAALADEMGDLIRCTFDSFDLARPLAPLVWNGEPITTVDQRRFLAVALTACRAYAADPDGWLYLSGPYGGGKSHLAAATALALMDGNRSTAYASVPDLLDFIRTGYDSGEADARVQRLRRVDVLVLDDLGSEKQSDWTHEKLFMIVNHRALHRLPTIVTSNLDIDALEGRIASRIAGLAQDVFVPVSDYRRRNRS